MTGMNATRNMENLSFYDAWVPVNGEYPEPASLAGRDGTTADAFDSYFSGTGNESNPYVITTAPELQAMNDSLDAHYELASDIDATETSSWNGGKGFDPVGEGGNNPVDFTGTFDGQGHTITGLTVNRTSDYNGLFRRIGADGSVSNLTLDAVHVTGGSNVGSLAGESYGAIQNVSATGNVTGNQTSGVEVGGLIGYSDGTVTDVSTTTNVTGYEVVGGLIGFNVGSVTNASASGTVSGQWGVGGLVGENDEAVISNATATATVSGNERVGGFVGFLWDGNVTDSLATGNVSGDVSVGGFVGENTDTANVTNASARGDVTGNRMVGGFVGENTKSSTVHDAFATGSVSGGADVGGFAGTVTSGSVTDAYWNTDTAGASGHGTVSGGTFDTTGLTSAEMTGMNATRNMGTLSFYDTWVPTKSGYPELASLAGTDGTTADAFDRYFAGDGTASNPYAVTTAPELQAMSDRLGAHYELGTDIDASETSSWNGGKGFESIGDSSNPFRGSFDGQGYTISDLTINRSTENDVGLFGLVTVGTVSNVTVSAVDITGGEKVGSVVGYVNGGSVRNVSASGSVNGTHTVGGLVGFFDGSVITNSSVSVATNAEGAVQQQGISAVGGVVGNIYQGDVSGVRASGSVSGVGHNVGGLVGRYNIGTLSNATATGDVSGDKRVGGLVGTGPMTVRNSSATGDVNGSKTVGGLIGKNRGTVSDSFSTGAVSGTDPNKAGGLIGYNDGTISDSYWRNTTSTPDTAFAAGTGNATGLTTAEMTGTNATRSMTGLDFAGTWEPTASYPELGEGYLADLPGDGTAASPYRLSNATELQAMQYDLTANYTLAADIDAVETSGWNDGNGFAPIGPDGSTAFVGSFDGHGHTISTLVINRSATDRVGLFGVVGDSGIVTNVSVSSVDVDGRDNVGGLAGDVFEGTVRNVSVSGTVNGSSKVGGLAGYLYNGSATESSSTVTVSGDANIGGLVGSVYDGNLSTVHASGAVHGIGQSGKNVGGLVGQYASGTVQNASASGDVGGPFNVGGLIGKVDGPTNATNVSAIGDVNVGSSGGGLVGSNRGTVRDAFTAGAVTGSKTGGLIGDNNDQGLVTNAYWDTTATGISTATGQNDGSIDATGLTTTEMTGAASAENMANLTFTTPWVTTDGYPVLDEHVTGLNLEIGTTSLAEGDTTDATVSLSLTGGRTATASTVADYANDDTSVATVEAGTVEAVGVGTTMLTVEHAGLRETGTLSVTDETAPTADAGSDQTVDEDTSLTLDGSGSTDNVGITSYTWTFGDGQTAIGQTVTHAYADPGIYTVTLTVTDAAGNTDTDTVTVTVESTGGFDPNPAPSPDPEPEPEPDPDPDDPTDTQNQTADPTQSTVWDNETTIRNQVTVPANVTVTRAEQVPIRGSDNTSEPVRATFAQNASVSSIQFPAETNGTVTVVEFDQQRPAYDDTPGRAVRQFQITGSPDVTNATATIRTHIAESELQPTGIDQSDVRLAHRTDGSWQILNTTVIRETNGTLVLEATTERLSPFALTAIGTPEAALSVEPTAVSTGDKLTLNAGNSTTPYGETVSYEWSIGGETHTGEKATLTPEAAGEYTVELTVTNDAGRTATATTTVVVENETGSETTPDGTPDNSTQTDPSTPATDDTATQPETTTGSSGPGFGIIIGVVALAGVALLAIRKSQ